MASQQFRILIVDDIPKNIQFAAQILAKEGYSISFAQSGIEALSIVRATEFDLILLDIMMPTMDGFEVCRQLKADPATSDIPVIFLTARSDIESVVEGFKLGGIDYIVKPFEMRELLARVSTHLNLKYYKIQEALQRAEVERIKNVELAAVNEQLRLLNNEKNEFISMVAHDLKNPLSSLRLIGKTLAEEPSLTIEDYKEFGADVLTLASQMFEMVTNFLDFHKIEHNTILPKLEKSSVLEILHPLCELYAFKAKEKGQSIITNFPSYSEAEIITDSGFFRQIMDNLISNAVKYSPFGKVITISAEKIHKGLEQSSLADDQAPFPSTEFVWKFIVEDQGPGFTEEDKEQLFKKFTRLSARPTGNEHSSGVGLSIVQRLVNMLGGDILCQSTLGIGTQFIIYLPDYEIPVVA